MSYTAYACIEILNPGFVRGAALIYFDAIPDVFALLAFPWGKWSKEDDLPPPVVKPRGLPKDVGHLVLSEIGLYVDEKEAKDPTNPRAISAKEAKKLKPFKTRSHTVYLNPDVKCPTWLTSAEVRKAADLYAAREGHPSSDLVAVASMMEQYERHEIGNGKHPSTRLVVWFT